MQILHPTVDGYLSDRDLTRYGGKHSWLYQLRHDGTGSVRIPYLYGIRHFDEGRRDVAGEMPFVSFELLKNGLILRWNCNQRIRCVGVQLSSIERIELTGHQILFQNRYWQEAAFHYGKLTFTVSGEEPIIFEVVSREFPKIKSYFEKAVFRNKTILKLEKPTEIRQLATSNYEHLRFLIEQMMS